MFHKIMRDTMGSENALPKMKLALVHLGQYKNLTLQLPIISGVSSSKDDNGFIP